MKLEIAPAPGASNLASVLGRPAAWRPLRKILPDSQPDGLASSSSAGSSNQALPACACSDLRVCVAVRARASGSDAARARRLPRLIPSHRSNVGDLSTSSTGSRGLHRAHMRDDVAPSPAEVRHPVFGVGISPFPARIPVRPRTFANGGIASFEFHAGCLQGTRSPTPDSRPRMAVRSRSDCPIP